MKYRLKKDLPFAKAGSPVTGNSGEALSPEMQAYIEKQYFTTNFMLAVPEQFLVNKKYYYIGSCEELLQEGWIEEVKPREWYIVRHADKGIVAGFHSRELAIHYIDNHYIDEAFKTQFYEVIKVQEVIE
jgi:hypothetical protein